MAKRKRLDVHLAESSLSASREKARREIISGWVKVNGETVREPSRPVTGEESIAIERPGGLFVSRGGEKLNHALEFFRISVRGRVAADLGASTGGFTHCLLVHGAVKVYAIDVGYGQLDYSLRNDPAVTVMERTHVKSLERTMFDPPPDFVTADLSFISILKAAPVLVDVFAPVEGVMLIKPQFEAARDEHKKGVVRKKEHHHAILSRVACSLSEAGIACAGLCFSPLKGPAGNIEFLMHFFAGKPGGPSMPEREIRELAFRTVENAHEYFPE